MNFKNQLIKRASTILKPNLKTKPFDPKFTFQQKSQKVGCLEASLNKKCKTNQIKMDIKSNLFLKLTFVLNQQQGVVVHLFLN